MKQKIIIDTDPGQDDAMAIMLGVLSNAFDILAITTVCGNSTIANTTRNARFILKLLGREDIAVYSGASKPLSRPLIQAVVHGKSGLEGIDPKIPAKLTNNASDKILTLVRENPNEIMIVTLGPMTNIARAIIKDPKTMKKIKGIVSMAGAINVAGNKNRVAEFNVFVDPEAAQVVFGTAINKTIITLDACNNVQMLIDDFRQIKNQKLRKTILKMVKPYIKNTYKYDGVNAALMYDPLTIFYLLSPEFCVTKQENIIVEAKGIYTRGMTIAEKRNLKKRPTANVKVVYSINSKEFIKYFIKTFNKPERVVE